MQKITIGITNCSKYAAYSTWIERAGNVETIKLSYEDDSLSLLPKCDGLLLSGGEDIHPRYYNKSEFVEQYNLDDIDEKRDALEWRVLEYAQQNKVPLLGICRGLQVANVFFGGTLIPDIPSFGKFNHSKFPDYDRYHSIVVDRDSVLEKITGASSGEVNSAHHQSVDKVGKELVVNAVSPDGIVEGMERLHPEGKPFLLLVQWHPERMNDPESPFTKNIRHSFLENVRTSKP